MCSFDFQNDVIKLNSLNEENHEYRDRDEKALISLDFIDQSFKRGESDDFDR